ncbi:hypothetical protein TNCV_1772721 [Trichonephila clavipes]|nr:hypothetical protein TNCV_1772721 [Trichonephila clavipes]
MIYMGSLGHLMHINAIVQFLEQSTGYGTINVVDSPCYPFLYTRVIRKLDLLPLIQFSVLLRQRNVTELYERITHILNNIDSTMLNRVWQGLSVTSYNFSRGVYLNQRLTCPQLRRAYLW